MIADDCYHNLAGASIIAGLIGDEPPKTRRPTELVAVFPMRIVLRAIYFPGTAANLLVHAITIDGVPQLHGAIPGREFSYGRYASECFAGLAASRIVIVLERIPSKSRPYLHVRTRPHRAIRVTTRFASVGASRRKPLRCAVMGETV